MAALSWGLRRVVKIRVKTDAKAGSILGLILKRWQHLEASRWGITNMMSDVTLATSIFYIQLIVIPSIHLFPPILFSLFDAGLAKNTLILASHYLSTALLCWEYLWSNGILSGLHINTGWCIDKGVFVIGEQLEVAAKKLDNKTYKLNKEQSSFRVFIKRLSYAYGTQSLARHADPE